MSFARRGEDRMRVFGATECCFLKKSRIVLYLSIVAALTDRVLGRFSSLPLDERRESILTAVSVKEIFSIVQVTFSLSYL